MRNPPDNIFMISAIHFRIQRSGALGHRADIIIIVYIIVFFSAYVNKKVEVKTKKILKLKDFTEKENIDTVI